jgi:hypothetical protein
MKIMARTIIIVGLLVVIIGTLGTASFLYYQRNLNEKGWNQVHLAESMVESENYDGAIKALLPVVEKGKKFEGAGEALYYLAMAYEGADVPEAKDVWNQLVEEFPDSPHYQEAKLEQARALAGDQSMQAKGIFEELVAGASEEIAVQARFELAQMAEKSGELADAKAQYYTILEKDVPWAIESKIKDRLTAINNQTLWSPVLDDFSQLYTVKPGDAPISVGQQFKTTAWYVKEANNIRSFLHPGRKLKVPKEPFRVKVNKEQCRLELLTESGRFIKWYPCGVGKQSYKTPPGKYEIINKEQDPTWYKPGGGIIKPGDPENALGTRWMGIGNSLGIHGTNEPETIGKAESAGCIRMYNKDVEELYKLLTYGSQVTIVEGN